jgi:hypothetical protein
MSSFDVPIFQYDFSAGVSVVLDLQQTSSRPCDAVTGTEHLICGSFRSELRELHGWWYSWKRILALAITVLQVEKSRPRVWNLDRMARSCDQQAERSDWQVRSQAISSASVQFSAAHLASGISHPAKCFPSDRGNSLLGSDTASEGGFNGSPVFLLRPKCS